MGIVECGHHYEEKACLHVEKMWDNVCRDWIGREFKEGSRANFGVEFIEHWDQITFGTSMNLINSNTTGSVLTGSSTGESFG